HGVPGFFATLRGALSDIPSAQPVTDELSWVIDFNDQVRRVRDIIESARPQISRLVTRMIAVPLDGPISADQIRIWREQVNAHVAGDAGFAYAGYVRLKLAAVRTSLAQLIVKLRGVSEAPLSRMVAEVIDVWASRRELDYVESEGAIENISPDSLARWARFLLAFDVGYRERRLHFLIEGQNRLYQLLDEARFDGLDPLVVDRLKREFYARLDILRRRQSLDFYSTKTRELAARAFPDPPTAREIRNVEAFAGLFVGAHEAELDRLLDQLSAEISLDASTRDMDELLATLSPEVWHPDARREVLINYLGFPFWDVLSFPVTSTRDMGEFNEILLDP